MKVQERNKPEIFKRIGESFGVDEKVQQEVGEQITQIKIFGWKLNFHKIRSMKSLSGMMPEFRLPEFVVSSDFMKNLRFTFWISIFGIPDIFRYF